MLEGARGVLIGVSGGADSVALLDMFSRLLSDAASPSIHVAHLDHMLRGRESEDDAKFVRSLAESMVIPITVAAIDTRAEAETLGRGIEEVARELRYKFLLATALECGADRIATGHTMNDQAETFLMRLARGAGLRGLAAIRPITIAHAFGNDESGRMNLAHDALARSADETACQSLHPSSFILHPLLIRPMLSITREEVEEYCRSRGLAFRTDETNLTTDYTRNRVRHEVLPALRAINPRAVEQISRTAQIIADDEDVLDHLAGKSLDEARLAGSTYSVQALLEAATGLRRRMILEAIRRERASASAMPEARSASTQITTTHLAAVEKLLDDSTSGSRVTLPGRLEVWREFDALVFHIAAPAPSKKREYEIELSQVNSHTSAGGFCLSLLRQQPGDLLKSALDEARSEKERCRRDWMMAVLDDRSLPDRLVVRPRRAGERAHVLGQSRTKKLKNLMIDHRIPTSRRITWPVVATPDGRYVWSPGLPPAVEFAAHDETHRLAILRASDA